MFRRQVNIELNGNPSISRSNFGTQTLQYAFPIGAVVSPRILWLAKDVIIASLGSFAGFRVAKERNRIVVAIPPPFRGKEEELAAMMTVQSLETEPRKAVNRAASKDGWIWLNCYDNTTLGAIELEEKTLSRRRQP